MKNRLTAALLLLLVIAALLTQVSCSRESNLPDFSGNTTGTIYVDYVKSYDSLGELAADADLIAVGTIDRTIEVVPDEATGETGDPRARTYLTRSAFRVERVIKGIAIWEIVISQMGARGWAEENGNPVFEPGERCFLFLRNGNDGMYHLVNPVGRFSIKDGNVYSMNYVLPTGQSRPPQGLKFWKIDLDEFIGRVTKEMPDIHTNR
jgi:hypothetical protein